MCTRTPESGNMFSTHRSVIRLSHLRLALRGPALGTDTRLCGDSAIHPRADDVVQRVIRVDHAGEFGADRIYAGQMTVLGRTVSGPIIQHMWDQEKKHLRDFQKLLQERRVRPTVLLPLWNVAGFVLGAGTALMGSEAAMACTVAVEEAIGEHYNRQLRVLMDGEHACDKQLLETIKRCRDDELEHLETGKNFGADQAPFYGTLTEVIKQGCRAAIWLSERV